MRFRGDLFYLVFLTGSPGAGKGTMCRWLKTLPNAVCLGVSDVLREYADRHPGEDQKTILESIQAGRLVPFRLVVSAVEEAVELAYEHGSEVVFLDGFPRDGEQARVIRDFRKALPPNIIFYHVNLRLSRTEAEDRLVGRAKQDIANGRQPRIDDLDKFKRQARLDEFELKEGQVKRVLSGLNPSVLASSVDLEASDCAEMVALDCLEVLISMGVVSDSAVDATPLFK